MMIINHENIGKARHLALGSFVQVHTDKLEIAGKLSILGFHSTSLSPQCWTMRRDLWGVRAVA
jgi:hypothetical protein